MPSNKYLLLSLFFSFLFIGVLIYFYPDKENFQNRPVSYSDTGRPSIQGIPQYIEDGTLNDFSYLHKYLEKQWALKDIGMIEALQQVQREKPKNLKKPIVAVIDTGIHASHPCFASQLWTNTKEIPNNNIDDDENGFKDDVHGWNFVDNDNDIQDYHGHGSHISGIIAAKGGHNCKVVGVSPFVEIMTLKYFDPHSKNSSNVENTVKAIEYAVEMGADIINYSGGGPGDNLSEKTAIAKAADEGIIFVAALGNEGSQIGDESSSVGERNQYYPASYKLSNIIAVQSHNKSDEKVESSNYKDIVLPGSKRKQTAPGEHIFSTLPPKIYLQGKLKLKLAKRNIAFSPIRDENYGYMTGTSQGTAVTTGVVALAKFIRPNWPVDRIIQLIDQTEKLSAYGTVSMRPQNLDLNDQEVENIRNTPHNPSTIDTMIQINNSIEKKAEPKL